MRIFQNNVIEHFRQAGGKLEGETRVLHLAPVGMCFSSPPGSHPAVGGKSGLLRGQSPTLALIRVTSQEQVREALAALSPVVVNPWSSPVISYQKRCQEVLTSAPKKMSFDPLSFKEYSFIKE